MAPTATAASGTARTPFVDGMRSRLRWPVLLSLSLHAAVIGLWPTAKTVIPQALPAGPIAVQLRPAHAGAPPAEHAAATPQPDMRRAMQRHAPPAKAVARTAPHNDTRPDVEPTTVRGADTAREGNSGDSNSQTRVRASTGTGAADSEALRAQLNDRLQHALVAHFDYPLAARRRGWEGVVRVGLRVEANGQLSTLRVIGSSGHALLDRAALVSLHRVGRLPGVVGWMQGRRLDMVLPIRYQLIDS